jgi:hypothetical protein
MGRDTRAHRAQLLQKETLTVPTETPAAYRARVASNAAKVGAQMPAGQNRANIPSPAHAPMTLPPMKTVTLNPNPTGRK